MHKTSPAFEGLFESGRFEQFTAFKNATTAREGFSGRIKSARENRNQQLPPQEYSLRSLFERYVTDLSTLSMYFSVEFRLSITRKLKALLNSENWDFEDPLPSPGAFLTLLRCCLTLDASAAPSIGTDGRRALSATWVSDHGRLTLTVRERDSVDFVLSKKQDDGSTDRAAGISSASRIKAALAPYDVESWLKQ
ncbi:hypothetical protein [Tabrizicola sp.]|uniref:hypothetical protein n=1 Tax=Tabrizicola sp. TaxID=2005166 RepID=UPI0035B26E26